MSEMLVADALGGLLSPHKSLSTWLLYDQMGCVLFDRITTLPEYYLTLAETDVLARSADDILATAADDGATFALAEIGAGSATKTELLISAALRRQHACEYLACDITPGPLAAAASRLRATYSGVSVRTFAGTHLEAGPSLASLRGRQALAPLPARAIDEAPGLRR